MQERATVSSALVMLTLPQKDRTVFMWRCMLLPLAFFALRRFANHCQGCGPSVSSAPFLLSAAANLLPSRAVGGLFGSHLFCRLFFCRLAWLWLFAGWLFRFCGLCFLRLFSWLFARCLRFSRCLHFGGEFCLLSCCHGLAGHGSPIL